MSHSLLARLHRFACALTLVLPAIAMAQTSDKPFSKEQLDQLTAQVALFPDALLSQVLMAATYPADVTEAAKWSRANSEQKGDAAVRLVENEPWDPSVKSLVAFPQVIIMMGEKPGWVKDLGDAFLIQPEDVMDSIQRLRLAAQNAGNLKSNEQVEVRVERSPPPTIIVEAAAPPPPPQVIVIEQRSPDVIFVPTYNPAYVFGPWPYPAYPPFFIPPPPGFWFSTAVATGIAWGVGIGISNAIWGNANWWNRSVNINVNRYNNININNRIDRANINNARWSHNVNNRREVAYRGGDRTRDQLRDRAQRVDREQFRGRDVDRQRAQQALQDRGINTDRAALRDVNRDQLRQQAPNVDRSQLQNRAQSADRSQLQNRAQNVDRSQLQNRAQNVDRSQLQNRAQTRNEAFQGVNDRSARQQLDRGNASRQSMQQAQRPQVDRAALQNRAGGGGAQQPRNIQRPSGGGGGGRPQVQRGGGGGRNR